MVDNENQWEDIEYSESQDDAQDYSYGEDDTDNSIQQDGFEEQADESNFQYNDYDEEDNGDEEYDEDTSSEKKRSQLPLIILALILLIVAGAVAIPKIMHNKEVQQANSQVGQTDEQSQADADNANAFFDENNNANSDMVSVDFNENGSSNVNIDGQDTATVSDVSPNDGIKGSDLFENDTNNDQGNSDIMVVYNKVNRLNPFKPPVAQKSTQGAPFETINNTQFEIIEPPVESVEDENLTRLLQTQISGILYDDVSPSAIVNINGMDQFVKAGDVVSGYKIQKITRDKVQISYKNNSYVASVGELFIRGSLDKQRAVANLENKFAGRYKN
jgi:cytoskeletal protein RodZ